MFKKEATGLGHLVAFFTSCAMLLYNKIDVADNIFAGDGAGQNISIMGKKKAHLLRVIAHGAG